MIINKISIIQLNTIKIYLKLFSYTCTFTNYRERFDAMFVVMQTEEFNAQNKLSLKSQSDLNQTGLTLRNSFRF